MVALKFDATAFKPAFAAPRPITAQDAAAAMVAAMERAGVAPRYPGAVAGQLESGRLVRFPCDKQRNPDGWARLHLDGVPAGAFGNWRLGVSQKWRADGDLAPGQRFDRADIAARRAAEREAERTRHIGAAEAAEALWRSSEVATASHPYLAAKRLPPDGLRQVGGALVVPLRDTAGKLWNCQRIYPDAAKRFLPGGRIAGLFWRAGRPADGGPVIIGEGYATMAAIHAATGFPVVAAMTAGNLLAVARSLAQALPSVRFVVAADLDDGGNGGIGLQKATDAAREIGAAVALPPMPAGELPGRSWDFADAWPLPGGPEAIRRSFAKGSRQ